MGLFYSDPLYKSICCCYSNELHRQVDAIQMGIHNICLYKEVDKQYTGCKLKTTELLDCALLEAYALIRLIILFFLFLLENIWLDYSLEAPQDDDIKTNVFPSKHMFWLFNTGVPFHGKISKISILT